MYDLKNNVDVNHSIKPALIVADADGDGVPLQGFKSAMVVFVAGTITDGTHTPKVQESDDDITYTDVSADELEGDALVAITTDSIQRVGYKGNAPFIKAFSTVTGAPGTGGQYGAQVQRSRATESPIA